MRVRRRRAIVVDRLQKVMILPSYGRYVPRLISVELGDRTALARESAAEVENGATTQDPVDGPTRPHQTDGAATDAGRRLGIAPDDRPGDPRGSLPILRPDTRAVPSRSLPPRAHISFP